MFSRDWSSDVCSSDLILASCRLIRLVLARIPVIEAWFSSDRSEERRVGRDRLQRLAEWHRVITQLGTWHSALRRHIFHCEPIHPVGGAHSVSDTLLRK